MKSPAAPSPLPRLVLVLKLPRAGFAKTRLGAEIGMERAARIYERMVERLLRGLHPPGRAVPWRAVVAGTPDDALDEMRARLSQLLPDNAEFVPQGDGDLGTRLERAFAAAFAQGAPAVVALGGDCPDVSPEEIERAFDLLRERVVVLGPATDGGYWTIGTSRFVPELFRDMPWSDPALADATRAVARRVLGPDSIAELAVKRDVDTAADLETLPEELRMEN